MNPNIGISEQHLAEVSQVLSHALADEFAYIPKHVMHIGIWRTRLPFDAYTI